MWTFVYSVIHHTDCIAAILRKLRKLTMLGGEIYDAACSFLPVNLNFQLCPGAPGMPLVTLWLFGDSCHWSPKRIGFPPTPRKPKPYHSIPRYIVAVNIVIPVRTESSPPTIPRDITQFLCQHLCKKIRTTLPL